MLGFVVPGSNYRDFFIRQRRPELMLRGKANEEKDNIGIYRKFGAFHFPSLNSEYLIQPGRF